MCDVEIIGCVHCWQVMKYQLIYIINLPCNSTAVEGDTNLNSVSESAVPAIGAQQQRTDFHLHNFLLCFLTRTLMPKHIGT